MFRYVYKTPGLFSDIVMSGERDFLTSLQFEGSKNCLRHIANCVEKKVPVFEETCEWLDIYFSGKNPGFTPNYRLMDLTPFRKDVIDILNKIPFGKTASYSDIANAVAQKRGLKKMSAQAAGGAVGWNPICIIIPCHRVVGKNAALTGYGGGIQNKIELLKLEGNDSSDFIIPADSTAAEKA